jgi:hypothetical protein
MRVGEFDHLQAAAPRESTISEVLFGAAQAIESHLADPAISDAHTGELRARVAALRDELIEIAGELNWALFPPAARSGAVH